MEKKNSLEQVEDVESKFDPSRISSSDFKTELPASLQGLSEEEFKKLEDSTRRKIDLRILPMLVLIYILNYLDRNNIATARLGGLEEDLGLKGSQYQTCISILFVGYILMQIPANMIMNKFGRPSIFLTGIMTVWGIISTCCGAVHSFGGLLAVRILLGIVEAGFSQLHYFIFLVGIQERN